MNKFEYTYKQKESEALTYYKKLRENYQKEDCLIEMRDDLIEWEKQQKKRTAFTTIAKVIDDKNKLKWLKKTGELDQYLDRSISYIYLRDLGYSLIDPATKARVKNVAQELEQSLLNMGEDTFHFASLFRWAQKEGVEQTYIWLYEKIKMVSDHMPEQFDRDNARRKLIKLIAGVYMHEVENMPENISRVDRRDRLARALRLGYCYGLTYPFIDDLLDSAILTEEEKSLFSDIIRTTIKTGVVPKFPSWNNAYQDFLQFIQCELEEAFQYIHQTLDEEKKEDFFLQAYVFSTAQEEDRVKSLSNNYYTNKEIYLPIILKSSSSRLIVRSLIQAKTDVEINQRIFYYGIYNQLADDFTDLFLDLENKAVTPYTYYLTYYKERDDLINPFKLYWIVTHFLIRHVYDGDGRTKKVILDRAMNGLKRLRNRLGEEGFREIMGIYEKEIDQMIPIIDRVTKREFNIDFLDKFIRDQILTTMSEERAAKRKFQAQAEQIKTLLTENLTIAKEQWTGVVTDAVNYSIANNGKKLRPLMTAMLAKEAYQLTYEEVLPLLKSLEYMHTASLIFDDLPSQDNAAFRRASPTLHNVYDHATAELAGVYLSQKAIESQASLKGFDPLAILSMMQYSTRMTAQICEGQALDLASNKERLTEEALTKMCYLKTGLGFEVALLLPMILMSETETNQAYMKQFAYHLGLAFQIKDDILDEEGAFEEIGKPVQLDQDNERSTFVTILGVENAKKAMWEHYASGYEVLKEFSFNTMFLQQLLDYVIHRVK